MKALSKTKTNAQDHCTTRDSNSLPPEPKWEAPSADENPTRETKQAIKEDAQTAALSQDQKDEIVRLQDLGFGTRKISKKVGVGRKVVRNLLQKSGLLEFKPVSNVSKLDPFRDAIKEKVEKQLTNARILREIKAKGYTGSRTILDDCIRPLRALPKPKKAVWRRFETDPGKETQFDWSPYRVQIAGELQCVHAFGAALGFSRKIHVRFYRNERERTLLEAHNFAFEDFKGVTQVGIYDRMATVVLGSIGKNRQPLWNPRFRDFAAYYGFEPRLCKVADPDRKGKVERIFYYLERDFLRGTEFDSLDDLNAKARIWLDEVANVRVHGTTRRIPEEAWLQEQPFLIPLPDSSFPSYDKELREVGPDSVISVCGTHYTVPAKLAHQTVPIHLFSDHFEVCDQKDQVVFARAYASAADHGKLIKDPAHYDSLHSFSMAPSGPAIALEDALLKRFPGLDALLAGIHLRMKSLTHIHFRALWRLADQYGDTHFAEAAARAQSFRRFDAQAVRRILEREHPLPDAEPEAPLSAAARVILALGNVDPGSLDDYAHLDSNTPSSPINNDNDK